MTLSPPKACPPAQRAYKRKLRAVAVTLAVAALRASPLLGVQAVTATDKMMMKGVIGVVVLTTAALLVTCSADSHQEPTNNDHVTERFDNNDPKSSMEGAGGQFMRETRQVRHPSWLPFIANRRLDYSQFGGKRELWPQLPAAEYASYYPVGLPKRNFDEIDRSGLDNFVKKRNFDEIDRSSLSFPFAAKRFVHLYAPPSFLGASDYDKKRNQREYQMDEIDLSSFPIGSKRSFENYPLAAHLF